MIHFHVDHVIVTDATESHKAEVDSTLIWTIVVGVRFAGYYFPLQTMKESRRENDCFGCLLVGISFGYQPQDSCGMYYHSTSKGEASFFHPISQDRCKDMLQYSSICILTYYFVNSVQLPKTHHHENKRLGTSRHMNKH